MAEPSTPAIVNGFVTPPPIDSLIDKKAFDVTIECTALRCERQQIQTLISGFHSKLFEKQHTRNISWLVKLEDRSPPESLIILREEVTPDTFSQEELDLIKKCNAVTCTYPVFIGFDHRPVEWLLAQYLPHIPNIVNSFETVGHIAHMNLRGEEMIQAKYTIGAIVLEKHKDIGIRTVVNKVGVVENEFRVLPMELLAGDPTTMVEVLECGCKFSFDFKEVFWNSRLQGEHNRIVGVMKVDDIVCDMFAGVGPFAIPLARKGVRVYANDLNPKSYEWMLSNADKNLGKRKRSLLTCYCLDGREFVRKMIAEGVQATHYLMNLPKLAPEFCDAFVKIFPKGWKLPRVHVYCFGTGETPEIAYQRALKRIEQALGGVTLTEPDLKSIKVRQTSTNTLEFCISFTVPPEVGYID